MSGNIYISAPAASRRLRGIVIPRGPRLCWASVEILFLSLKVEEGLLPAREGFHPFQLFFFPKRANTVLLFWAAAASRTVCRCVSMATISNQVRMGKNRAERNRKFFFFFSFRRADGGLDRHWCQMRFLFPPGYHDNRIRSPVQIHKPLWSMQTRRWRFWRIKPADSLQDVQSQRCEICVIYIYRKSSDSRNSETPRVTSLFLLR